MRIRNKYGLMKIFDFTKFFFLLPAVLVFIPLSNSVINGGKNENLNLNKSERPKDAVVEWKFRTFMRTFGKNYKIGSPEYFQRLKNFNKSLSRHPPLNSAHSSMGQIPAKFGITKFADLSPSEFQSQFLQLPSEFKTVTQSQAASSKSSTSTTIPKTFDWRKKNAVTAVKNQESCGACWAFSVVEVVESINAIQHGDLTELSVQQVINCAYEEHKCNGGDIKETADWLVKDGVNLTTESNYPLTDTSGDCTINPKSGVQVASRLSTINYIGNEDSMVKLLATQGPLAVAVDAALWQDYLGGVIQFHCGTTLNHAVEVVGYNNTGSSPYFIVRNSWGTDFGHSGYLYIKIGGNICGIASEVISLNVK